MSRARTLRDRRHLHPLFDGYAASENRGTLALAYTLHPDHSPGLLSSFSSAFLGSSFPARRNQIQAHLQLVLVAGGRGATAIPDAAFVNHEQKRVLLIESKIEPRTLNLPQLRRHLANAKRRFPGYGRVLLFVSPDPTDLTAPGLGRLDDPPDVLVRSVRWLDVHEWASKHLRTSPQGRRSPVTSTFLTQQLLEFLRGRNWMGFQGFPADWPEEYRITDAREHLKALREYFRDHARREVRGWPSDLMPAEKKLTLPWFPVGTDPVHLTVYAWQDWTGVDLYVPRPVARRRLDTDEDWRAFLGKIRSLPERKHAWVKASRWSLINHTQGKQSGPVMYPIEFSVRAEDLLDAKGRPLTEALRRLACDGDVKAMAIEYRYYFQDTRLRSALSRREFGNRLIRSAGRLLDLYRWFNTTPRRRR